MIGSGACALFDVGRDLFAGGIGKSSGNFSQRSSFLDSVVVQPAANATARVKQMARISLIADYFIISGKVRTRPLVDQSTTSSRCASLRFVLGAKDK